MLTSELIFSLTIFLFIALAASQIGHFGARLHLPRITGYLVAGAVAGPFFLNLLTSESVEQLQFIDDFSLAIIAFAAGSELYLRELRSRLKSIGWVTAGLLITFVWGTIAIFLLGDIIPFMQEMNAGARLAVALMGGAILVARSPSSAIAVINELRAKGPFTKMAIGVTVVMDVLDIVLFAIAVAVADALLTNLGFNLSTIVLIVIELVLAVGLGYILARLLQAVLSLRVDRHIKTAAILVMGFSIFLLSEYIREYTHEHLPFEILLEPLLTCVISSFVVVNFSAYRDEFIGIIHDVSPYIFVMFFTLTGATLSLDTLASIWPIALILFAVRLIGIAIGTFIGSSIAGEPPAHRRLTWMAFVTQAGVGLALSKEVITEFPEFGTAFATLFISLIVLNEVVGPLFFKSVIRRVGEARVAGAVAPDDVRDVLIVGIESQSRALAKQLRSHGWQVNLVDIDSARVGENSDIPENHLSDISLESLKKFVTHKMDAVVAMLPDDEANLRLVEIIYQEFGISRLVVRCTTFSDVDEFRAMGAFVVDTASAMVHLLDNVVRAPELASFLLQDHPQNAVVQITVTNPDVAGMALRDLMLPNDVLVMAIHRDGDSIVPQGFSTLELHDEVTVIGSPESLRDVTLKLGF